MPPEPPDPKEIFGKGENEEIGITLPTPGIVVYDVENERIEGVMSPPFPPLLPAVIVRVT